MILESLGCENCPWLQADAPQSGWVLSSRVRLARNLEGMPFPSWASTTQLENLISGIQSTLEQSAGELGLQFEFYRLDRITQVDREFLLERSLVSREMIESTCPRMVALSTAGDVSVMVGEEDHLRICAMAPGLQLQEAGRLVDRIDDCLIRAHGLAWEPELGFLTACPTNVGTGLRCSVMIHLPALVLTNEIEKAIPAARECGFTIRGSMGEGSHVMGNLFQVSNQHTLGRSEADLLECVTTFMLQLLEYERQAEQQIRARRPDLLADRVQRARALLSNAWIMDHQEAESLLSDLRLGINTGQCNDIALDTINELILSCRPAHIQKRFRRTMDSAERDRVRASVIRDRLN